MDPQHKETIALKYVFSFKDGTQKEFPITLDGQTMRLIKEDIIIPPGWAKLKEFRCPNCPLDASEHEFCPMAAHLSELIDYFKSRESTEEINLLIETKERKYEKKVSLQDGLGSLFGIYMVTTGCPILEKLKPMVRYHLPFSTMEETTYRVVTMYLMAQYFLNKKGRQVDWTLKDLAKIYSDIQAVNSNVSDKVRNIIKKDASINALVKLDCSAFYISFRLNSDILNEIESYFNAYLQELPRV